jgi:hypothetical protein
MPVVRPAIGGQHQPSEVWFFLLRSIQPWFRTEGKLAAILFTAPSCESVSRFFLALLPGIKEEDAQRLNKESPRVNSAPASRFSSAVAGKGRRLLQGEYRTLTLFILF